MKTNMERSELTLEGLREEFITKIDYCEIKD